MATITAPPLVSSPAIVDPMHLPVHRFSRGSVSIRVTSVGTTLIAALGYGNPYE